MQTGLHDRHVDEDVVGVASHVDHVDESAVCVASHDDRVDKSAVRVASHGDRVDEDGVRVASHVDRVDENVVRVALHGDHVDEDVVRVASHDDRIDEDADRVSSHACRVDVHQRCTLDVCLCPTNRHRLLSRKGSGCGLRIGRTRRRGNGAWPDGAPDRPKEGAVMSSGAVTKVSRVARINQVVSGIQKDLTKSFPIVLGGTSYDQATLVALLQGTVAAIQKASDSKAAWQADVQVMRNEVAGIAAVLRYIKAFVVTQFGDTQDSAQKLADFGYTPRKVPVKTVAEKALAVEKGKATRVARGTKGPKQKAQIKGSVDDKPSTGGEPATTPATAAPGATATPAAKPVS